MTRSPATADLAHPGGGASRILLGTGLLLLGACEAAEPDAGNAAIANEQRTAGESVRRVDDTDSRDITILPPAAAKAMLEQCSRDAPAPGESGWTPQLADIRRFEAALPKALQRPDVPNRAAVRGAPDGWLRQYVGIVRGGHRYIYGNFVPREMMNDTPGSRHEAIVICDGGPSIFGAEYDVQGGRVTHLGFNGPPEAHQ